MLSRELTDFVTNQTYIYELLVRNFLISRSILVQTRGDLITRNVSWNQTSNSLGIKIKYDPETN